MERQFKKKKAKRKTEPRDLPSRVNNLGSYSHLHFDGTIQINEQCFVLLLPRVGKLRLLRESAASFFHSFKLGTRHTTTMSHTGYCYQYH